jgi:hypothetical protein
MAGLVSAPALAIYDINQQGFRRPENHHDPVVPYHDLG